MPNKSQPLHSGDIIADTPELTLDDLCEACELTRDQIAAYVSEGIIEPEGARSVLWRFSQMSIIKVRRANRLERDLGLNTPGIALVLDLMAELDTLKRRLARLDRESSDDV